MGVRSFRELEQDPDVKSEEVTTVFESYVDKGASIIATVVIDLIGRTGPSQAERARLKDAAKRGAENQTERRFHGEAMAYQRVLHHLGG